MGQQAGVQVLIRKLDTERVGIFSGVAVLLITAFLSGWTGFFQEGLTATGTFSDALVDYVFKPFFWITVVGMLPALLIGLWFGWRLKSKGLTQH